MGAQTSAKQKVLSIYINEVEFSVANHSFYGMQTEFSITTAPQQLLVGVHAVHSDVFIPDCPQLYKVVLLALCARSRPLLFLSLSNLIFVRIIQL